MDHYVLGGDPAARLWSISLPVKLVTSTLWANCQQLFEAEDLTAVDDAVENVSTGKQKQETESKEAGKTSKESTEMYQLTRRDLKWALRPYKDTKRKISCRLRVGCCDQGDWNMLGHTEDSCWMNGNYNIKMFNFRQFYLCLARTPKLW